MPDTYKIGSYDRKRMLIHGHAKGCVDGSIDESDAIFLALMMCQSERLFMIHREQVPS